MSNDNKEQNNKQDDIKEYNFIEEKVISRKKQKIKKVIFAIVMTIILGGLFGLTAGVVMCVTEQPLYSIFGKDKKFVEFPSEDSEPDKEEDPPKESEADKGPEETEEVTNPNENRIPSDTVIINNAISADEKDLISIYAKVKSIADETCDSMVLVTSIKSNQDWFQNEIEVPDDTIGLIVGNNGVDLLVLVNYDRVQGANAIMVSFNDETKVEATLQSFDGELNLGVIAITIGDLPEEFQDLKVASLGESAYLPVGTPLVAIGSPNGYIGSMEIGMVSTRNTNTHITDYQVDLFHSDINYVADGEGYVINLRGDIIGIITNKLSDSRDENINTFMGITSLKPIIESLVNNENRSYLGITATDITSEALSEFNLENGIAVTRVVANSPAFNKGIQIGDIITGINNTDIGSVKEFQKNLIKSKPEDVIKLEIYREYQIEDEVIELEIMLGTRKL